MLTPNIVHYIVAAFKERKDELLKEVVTNEDGEFGQATFSYDGWLVTAHINVEDGIWFRLEASPEDDIPDSEPAVVLLISPPEDETWR